MPIETVHVGNAVEGEGLTVTLHGDTTDIVRVLVQGLRDAMNEMNDLLHADVAWLRNEAGHVDVEHDFGGDTPAGDGLRGIADRIEHLQERHATLLAALDALVQEAQVGRVMVGETARESAIRADERRYWGNHLAAEIAKHREER